MKKTKTGLHIQTRKNRIEVYTEKELEAKELKREKTKRACYITAMVYSLRSLCVLY